MAPKKAKKWELVWVNIKIFRILIRENQNIGWLTILTLNKNPDQPSIIVVKQNPNIDKFTSNLFISYLYTSKELESDIRNYLEDIRNLLKLSSI